MDITTTIQAVRNKLINTKGNLCSPRIHSPKNKDLVDCVTEHTNYLPPSTPFSRRWWHLINGPTIPRCYCGNTIHWNDHSKFYPKYCSQLCAVTSPEATTRTHQQFTGSVVPTERALRSKQTRVANGYYRDRSKTIELLSKQKRGCLNPQYRKVPWNKGLPSPSLGKKFPGRGLSGVDNPRYGKSPSKYAGRGIRGWFGGYHFRSSLELFYLMYWDDQHVSVISAESDTYRVPYIGDDGRIRTYSPDFFVVESNTLVELKPENLHNNKIVKLKLEALQHHHPDKACVLLGYADIADFIVETIHTNIIDGLITSGKLIMSTNQLERLKHNYADIIRATIQPLQCHSTETRQDASTM